MKHLSEEKYQRRKSLRITAGIIIICFGFAIAATLTGMGIKEVRENKLRYSPENRSAVYEQLRQEEARLLILKQEHRRRRSWWMLSAFGGMLLCTLVSLIARFPAPGV